ncbi:MAG: multiprotein bridging factor aMBF1 [Candidatus Thorarchaeota archaeon]
MAKKNSSQLDKECQICGGLIWGKGVHVMLEGAKITVCQSCAQYGIKIQEKKTKLTSNQKIHKESVQKRKQQPDYSKEFDKFEIVADFAKIINNIRNNLGLNQDKFAKKLNEKPSLLKRIESGKVEPTIQLAKKIEKVYGVKLIKEIESIEASFLDSKYIKKTSGTSLGDIAFIKKKKK